LNPIHPTKEHEEKNPKYNTIVAGHQVGTGEGERRERENQIKRCGPTGAWKKARKSRQSDAGKKSWAKLEPKCSQIKGICTFMVVS
jgi:hypothetical protein